MLNSIIFKSRDLIQMRKYNVMFYYLTYFAMSSTCIKILAEYAKSGRSSCKKCSEKIESKSIRLGLSSWDPRGFETTKWHHIDCFFPLDADLASAESIEGFSDLKVNSIGFSLSLQILILFSFFISLFISNGQYSELQNLQKYTLLPTSTTKFVHSSLPNKKESPLVQLFQSAATLLLIAKPIQVTETFYVSIYWPALICLRVFVYDYSVICSRTTLFLSLTLKMQFTAQAEGFHV